MGKNNSYELNSAQCLICNDILIATFENEQHQCSCGNLIVTGNLMYNGLVRYIKQIDDYKTQYKELSLYDTGHPIADGHQIIKPQSALNDMIIGKCFIQRHINFPERGWRMLDEYGQSLQVVEIEVGKDGLYDVTARFRFRPVSGFNFYVCGRIDNRALDFLAHIMHDIIPPFLAEGHTKKLLYETLITNGYQDRTGMLQKDWRI